MQEFQDIQVMYDDPTAATFRTGLSGWVSRNGRYFGRGTTAEHQARYDGSTHKKCEGCGNPVAKHNYCKRCYHNKLVERYRSLPVIDWDGVTPICLFDDDKYFFSEGDLMDYCWDNETQPESLMLVLCTPHYLREVTYDYWCDDMTEDMEELPRPIVHALDTLNRAIRECNELQPISWSEGKKRVTFTLNHKTQPQ